MEKVLADIQAVEASIKQVEDDLVAATNDADKAYLRQKELALRQEKHDLRQEKHDLRQKELALLNGASAEGQAPAATDKFFLRNDFLSRLGIVGQAEQYSLYGSIGAGLGGYLHYSRKFNLLRQYVNEPDVEVKRIIGGKFPFTPAELDGATAYLKRYGKSPRHWLLFPLAFITVEGLRVALWGKSAK